MPVYKYKCSKCDETLEVLRKIQQRDDAYFCPVCNTITKRVVTTPAGIDGGFTTGYTHRTGKTGIWKTDVGPQGKLGREWYGDMPHADSTLAKE